MPLMEEFQKSGLFLFKWRSYALLAFLPVVFASLDYFYYPFQSHKIDTICDLFCLFIGVLGITLRVLTVAFVPEGTSERGTRRLSASRLNTTGMYSIVRNPLYLGNFLIYTALVLSIHIWWVFLLFILAFTLYYERIIFAEEMFLRENFGEEYISWASKTPAFFPRFRNWAKPDLPFSWKMALFREYHGVYGLIFSFFWMELASDFYINKEWKLDSVWIVIFIIGTFFYVTVRFLVKKTSFLNMSVR